MATNDQLGDAVVVVGHGVGRITSRDAARLVVRLDEGEVAVNVIDAASLLRPVVDATQAQAMVTRLCERCAEPRSLPEVRSIRDLARAPLERQVEYTRILFRDREALSPREIDVLVSVSETVLGELAMALGVTATDLRAAVKRGQPAVSARVRRVLPPAPAVEGAELLRSFWLGSTAVIGERPEATADVIRVSVKPGAWHAYVFEGPEDGDDDDHDDVAREGIILRHHDLPSDTPRVGATVRLGVVNLEGGTIGVLDASALDDATFGVDEVERTRRDGEGYGDRGVEARTLGDGAHDVLADAATGAMLLVLPF